MVFNTEFEGTNTLHQSPLENAFVGEPLECGCHSLGGSDLSWQTFDSEAISGFDETTPENADSLTGLQTEAALVGSNPIPPAPPNIPNRTLQVTDYGAKPNDGKDDTQAIQKAIDAMAAQGGGNVLFAPGQYDVSIRRDLVKAQALIARSNIRLAPNSNAGATIRLANNQGNYESIISAQDFQTPLNDFVIRGLTFDLNGQNNPVSPPKDPNNPDVIEDFSDGINQRMAFGTYTSQRIRINGCRFINSQGVWILGLNGDEGSVSDVEVINSRFENVGGGNVDYDHSSIYTNGPRMRIANNVFTSRNGAGTKGARTAIEIHHFDQIVTGNVIKGYTVGMNVVGDQETGGERQLYRNNTIENVNVGFLIWSYREQQPAGQSALRNISIDNNTVRINADDWLKANLVSASEDGPSGGIVLEANGDAPIQKLSITNNKISFTKAKPVDFFHDQFSSGITLWKYLNPNVPIRDLTITNNRIENSLGAGIYSTVRIVGDTQSAIANNTIINAARSSFLNFPEADDYRSGIYIDSETKNLSIQDNKIVDTTNPDRLKYGVVAISKSLGNSTLQGNSVSGADVSTVKAGNSWNGVETASLGSSENQLETASLTTETTKTYTIDYTNFPNPERGFHSGTAPLWIGTEKEILDPSFLNTWRQQGISVYRFLLVIDEFRTKPISQEALSIIDASFDQARQYGFKVVPIVSYSFDILPQTDTSVEQVLKHINQLAPVFQANSDIISHVEAGFIGPWGEWHSSTNGLLDANNDLNSKSRQILDAVLTKLVPGDRMVTLRRPDLKQDYTGSTAPLTVQEAFTGTAKARLGASNFCFLVNKTDAGTYPDNNAGIEAAKNFLNRDNLYVPQWGETCGFDGVDSTPYTGSQNAIKEMQRMRWSILNTDYYPETIQRWKNEGSYDQIARRLGYRFRMVNSTIDAKEMAGGTLDLDIVMENRGFASPYNPRRAEIVLRHETTGKETKILVKQDARLWLPQPGQIKTLSINAKLPTNLATGDYKVFLNLPDPESTLYGRPAYSIRLANQGVWEGKTGYNNLKQELSIAPT